MELGYILRRAWEITWRHKVLWLFGFLIALSSGAPGRGNINYLEELPPEMERAIYQFVTGPYFLVVVVALVALGLAIGLVLALVGALGRAALVDQVREAEEGDTPEVSAGFRAGWQRMWPVFLIRFLLRLPVALLVLIGMLPVLVGALSMLPESRPGTQPPPNIAPLIGSLLACLLPAMCLIVLLLIPLGVLERLSIRACVLERLPLGKSLKRGWDVLKGNLGPIALLWLIMLGIGIGVALVIGLPLALGTIAILVPLVLTAMASPILAAVLVLAVGLVAWLLGAAIGGVVETFTSATWTLAYRELTGLGTDGGKPAGHVTCCCSGAQGTAGRADAVTRAAPVDSLGT